MYLCIVLSVVATVATVATVAIAVAVAVVIVTTVPSASAKSHLSSSSHLIHLTIPTEYGRPPAELHPDAATDPRPPPARRHILVPAGMRPGRSIRQGSRERCRCSHGWGYSRCPILASLCFILFSRTAILIHGAEP